MASALLALTALATRRLGTLRPGRTPALTTPCQSKRPLAVLVRTSSSMVSGTLGRLCARS